MKKEVKIRESNFELMRIISMFMIVLWHVIIHGNLINNTTGKMNILISLVLYICIVHVNSFVMVTGYFQYNKDFSLKKFLKIFNLQWFYKVMIVLILSIIGIITIPKIDFIREILPIGSTSNYWFINCYLVLYLLSPFLNKFIKSIDQEEHKKCLLISFLLFSVVAYITNNATVNNNGSTIIQFVFLYLLGAYLNKYSLKEELNIKRYSKRKLQIILLSFGASLCIINFLFLIFSLHFINSSNEFLQSISNTVISNRYGYSNPLVILQTICYFLYFKTLSFKNSFINKISATTFGIYLIHDNSYIRSVIYKKLLIDTGTNITSKKYLIYMFIAAFIIFSICTIIEYIRSKIATLVSNSSLSKKIKRNINSLFKLIRYDNINT